MNCRAAVGGASAVALLLMTNTFEALSNAVVSVEATARSIEGLGVCLVAVAGLFLGVWVWRKAIRLGVFILGITCASGYGLGTNSLALWYKFGDGGVSWTNEAFGRCGLARLGTELGTFTNGNDVAVKVGNGYLYTTSGTLFSNELQGGTMVVKYFPTNWNNTGDSDNWFAMNCGSVPGRLGVA